MMMMIGNIKHYIPFSTDFYLLHYFVAGFGTRSIIYKNIFPDDDDVENFVAFMFMSCLNITFIYFWFIFTFEGQKY